MFVFLQQYLDVRGLVDFERDGWRKKEITAFIYILNTHTKYIYIYIYIFIYIYIILYGTDSHMFSFLQKAVSSFRGVSSDHEYS